jgi:CheY-like chemotaxis protein
VYFLNEAFKQCGYPYGIQFAASHQEATQLLSSQPFDLLLSDFGNNTEDAQDFIRSVRAVSPRLPIIIFSGTVDQNNAYDAGATAFIAKTTDLPHLLEKIHGLMRFWIDVAELPYQR